MQPYSLKESKNLIEIVLSGLCKAFLNKILLFANIKSPCKGVVVFLTVTTLFSSCATFTKTGVGRVKHYAIESDRLPYAFDGLEIAFISDIHYPSKFTRKRLGRVVRTLQKKQPDILLLGGDYVTSDAYIDELFDSLASVKPFYGIYAVMGNHELRRSAAVVKAMKQRDICLLSDETIGLKSDDSIIFLSGIANSFAVDSSTISPTDAVADSAFTILLSHTPDYAEDTDARADLVLSGHTHGGQVSLFGIITPVKNTHYGTRFLRGLNYTDAGVPVITTNGVGTSRRKLRFCVPSEIVIITLHSGSSH